METYFTSDLHFGHYNIIKYCHRHFSSIEEMDSLIINNLNRDVDWNDSLYIIGDFTMSHNSSFIKKYRDAINCHNVYLILGNHDSRSIDSYNSIFKRAYAQKVVKVNGQKIHMNHYAMRVWESSHNGSWHLYGHSHGCLHSEGKSMDVGVDTNNFKAYHFEQIADIMAYKDDTQYRE